MKGILEVIGLFDDVFKLSSPLRFVTIWGLCEKFLNLVAVNLTIFKALCENFELWN